MYAFSEGTEANVVIRPDKLEAGLAALEKNNIKVLSEKDVCHL
jgi:hypothetical protein